MSYEDQQRSLREQEREAQDRIIRIAVRGTIGVLVACIGIWMLVAYAGPQLNLYRANTEKQAVIAEQKAISEAAIYEAEKAVTVAEAEREARVIAAEGIAEANAVIASGLTGEEGEAYLRYEFIQQFADAGETVIYVPFDGELPVTEAGRAVEDQED